MYTRILYIVMMTMIGFVIFDHIGVSVAFGIGTGSIFGYMFAYSHLLCQLIPIETTFSLHEE